MAQERTCPYCGCNMNPIVTPLESSWGGEIHYVCFNDECSYFVNSWQTLDRQGVEKTGYRCRMDPRGAFGPLTVWSAAALKDLVVEDEPETCPGAPEKGSLDYFKAEDFARDDETPDNEFYTQPRPVHYLDSTALAAVEELYASLIPKEARILDLMAGPDSRLPAGINPVEVTGLGLNSEELETNKMLGRKVIHDINAQPTLPFPTNEFDAVINTISVDYMTRPVEIFREVGRVLKAGGLFIVVFSNRTFPPKAVGIWKKTDEAQRVDLVKKYIELSGCLALAGASETRGKPRPEDDKYYSLGIPSDPIYALWARAEK